MDQGALGAVILTGGTAARLDGADKAGIEIGGRTLLELALDSVAAATEVVVAGPHTPTSRPVTFAVEDPPGGGPAAGLLTALDWFAGQIDRVAVLAVDMPLATGDTMRRLAATVRGPEIDGAVLLDDEGRRQHLCGVYRARALLRAAPGPAARHGLAMGALIGGLRLADVPAVGGEARDVDTWTDLAQLRERARPVPRPVRGTGDSG